MCKNIRRTGSDMESAFLDTSTVLRSLNPSGDTSSPTDIYFLYTLYSAGTPRNAVLQKYTNACATTLLTGLLLVALLLRLHTNGTVTWQLPSPGLYAVFVYTNLCAIGLFAVHQWVYAVRFTLRTARLMPRLRHGVTAQGTFLPWQELTDALQMDSTPLFNSLRRYHGLVELDAFPITKVTTALLSRVLYVCPESTPYPILRQRCKLLAVLAALVLPVALFCFVAHTVMSYGHLLHGKSLGLYHWNLAFRIRNRQHMELPCAASVRYARALAHMNKFAAGTAAPEWRTLLYFGRLLSGLVMTLLMAVGIVSERALTQTFVGGHSLVSVLATATALFTLCHTHARRPTAVSFEPVGAMLHVSEQEARDGYECVVGGIARNLLSLITVPYLLWNLPLWVLSA